MMMDKVKREDIIDYQTYNEKRDAIRAKVLEIKKPRRIHVGENLTFLFENRETVIYQIQEMMRTEQIVKEKDIQHEIDTYNEFIGDRGELGCTLLIEFTDEKLRAEKLVKLVGLMDKITFHMEDGTTTTPLYDKRQVGDEKLSSVQYLRINFGSSYPLKITVDHPELQAEHELTEEQQTALRTDLELLH